MLLFLSLSLCISLRVEGGSRQLPICSRVPWNTKTSVVTGETLSRQFHFNALELIWNYALPSHRVASGSHNPSVQACARINIATAVLHYFKMVLIATQVDIRRRLALADSGFILPSTWHAIQRKDWPWQLAVDDSGGCGLDINDIR